MGLYVHTLAEIPSGAQRNYYVYLLDYGWDEPLGEAVRANISKMADRASRTNAVVIQGPPVHFADEVLSWHNVNGEPGESVLPAILITTRHPSTFCEHPHEKGSPSDDALLLIPLKKVCETATEVVDLVERVFGDIKEKRKLVDFNVYKQLRAGVGQTIVDAVILQPSLGGIGIDLKKLFGLADER